MSDRPRPVKVNPLCLGGFPGYSAGHAWVVMTTGRGFVRWEKCSREGCEASRIRKGADGGGGGSGSVPASGL